LTLLESDVALEIFPSILANTWADEVSLTERYRLPNKKILIHIVETIFIKDNI
jgi:hypothetical protein